MSLIIPKVRYGYDPISLLYRAFGRPPLAASPTFVLGETMPTPENSGVLDGVTLTPYDSDIATPRTIVISTPGTHFERTAFGNIRLDFRADDCGVHECQFKSTNNRTSTPMIRADQMSVGGDLIIEQSTFENLDQMGYGYNAIQGHDYTAYRNKIMGMTDGVRTSNGGNVKVHGNFIGYFGWWGTHSGGPALNSGFQSHSDGIQTTTPGIEVVGNSIWGYASEIVGTGTPGNGTDAGNPDGWYTQAESVARRLEALTYYVSPARSIDGLPHYTNGYLTPLMLTLTGGGAMDAIVEDNWFAGGLVHVNGSNANLSGNLGSFKRNKHQDDAGARSGGRGVGYFLRSTVDADIPVSPPDRNVYLNDGVTVPRYNLA